MNTALPIIHVVDDDTSFRSWQEQRTAFTTLSSLLEQAQGLENGTLSTAVGPAQDGDRPHLDIAQVLEGLKVLERECLDHRSFPGFGDGGDRLGRGEIQHFTGVNDPYEPPPSPDVLIRSDKESVDESVVKIIGALKQRGLLG